jgi:hypothetical protein
VGAARGAGNRALSRGVVSRPSRDRGRHGVRQRERAKPRSCRELYLINPAKYSVPEQIDVVHILFDTTKRSSEAALAAAKEARAKIVAGADMGALAKELSDDASAAKNAGKIPR